MTTRTHVRTPGCRHSGHLRQSMSRLPGNNDAGLMARTSLTALAAFALLALMAAPALAGPNEDYTGVKRNWAGNQTRFVTPCRFSEGQLFNAVMVSQYVPDD